MRADLGAGGLGVGSSNLPAPTNKSKTEFVRQAEEQGADRFDAAAQAARTRLRPILMTSFAFILGVVPLVFATGAGAEMRQALGTAVFFGMLGVTLFGLLFTPVLLRRHAVGRRLPKPTSLRTAVAGPSAGRRSSG